MDMHPSLGFNDFDNDFPLSNLEWEWPGNHDSGNAESQLSDAECSYFSITDHSLVFPDRFDNFDTSFSLADLDTLELGMSDGEADEDDDGPDSKLNAFHMYEMYGSDWGNDKLE